MRAISSYDNHHIRITLWPGVPLTLPPLRRRSLYRLSESATALIGAPDEVPVEKPHEVYLRLYDLDLADPEQILEFANQHGAVNGTLLTTLHPSNFFAGKYSLDADRQVREAAIETDPEVRRCLDPNQPDWPASFAPLEITPLTSFIFAARCLRDLTTAWRIINNDPRNDPASAQWEVYSQPGSPTQAGAVSLLTHGLPPLLHRFAPFVRATPTPSGYEDADEIPAELSVPPTSPSGPILEQAVGLTNPALHEFCALELYNHIAGHEAYRHCQNETCTRIFVRQYGRAEHGQSRRQGVLYCTHACAQAQAQREYRRRKAARQDDPGNKATPT
jgi:hypothetical protein